MLGWSWNAQFGAVSQYTQYIHPMLAQCCASVVDGWPALRQHWVNVLYLLGYIQTDISHVYLHLRQLIGRDGHLNQSAVSDIGHSNRVYGLFARKPSQHDKKWRRWPSVVLILGHRPQRWQRRLSVWLECKPEVKEATIQSPDVQGGGEVYVTDKLFISTRLSSALKIFIFSTCLYRTVLDINYLFHSESARNYLFQKYSSPPLPLGDWMVPPWTATESWVNQGFQYHWVNIWCW